MEQDSKQQPGNAELVEQVLGLCLGLGVKEWCVAAGARNAPLVRALLEGDDDFGRVRNFFEERSAGFFALGRSMDLKAPVAVVVTSGTALAELLPAVIEAHYTARPLVVVSADRPKRYRGSGAPQAIEQAGIFGVYTQWSVDLPSNASSKRPARITGPVHINVCLEEPLFEAWREMLVSGAGEIAASASSEADEVSDLLPFVSEKERTLLVAGALSREEGKEVASFAQALGLPLWGEAISNLPSGATSLQMGEKIFAERDMRPERVLRFGGVPTSRFWRNLEDWGDVEVLSVGAAPFSGLARSSQRLEMELRGLAEAVQGSEHESSDWGDRLLRSQEGLRKRLDSLLEEWPESEAAWVRRLSSATEVMSSVFLGNSLPIREWNVFSDPAQGRAAQCFANRGANGIDGAFSTYLGLSADSADPSMAVVGDLTALYDLAGPWIIPQLGEAVRTLAVINNGGGKIFERLPALAALEQGVRQGIENRHRISFEGFAQLWEMDHTVWREDRGQESVPEGVLEICPDEKQSARFWEEWGRLSP